MDSRVSVLIDIRSNLAGLEQATAGFGQLIKTVAGFAAAYLSARAVVSGAREIITLGGDLDHLSSQTGITVSSLMTLQQAFEDNGISGQKVGKSINDMQRRLSDAARGTGTAKIALDQFGLSAQELIKLSPEQQFDLLPQKIAAIENPAERAAAAIQLFGKSGVELMPLFKSGGAIDSARTALGQMPAILERNATLYEYLDTLISRTSNKSKQLFVGIGDLLADALLAPLERLDAIDLTPVGQKIGAFMDLALESFRDGTFADFIGLNIEAGFEQGMSASRN